jgi:hypothetical protein
MQNLKNEKKRRLWRTFSNLLYLDNIDQIIDKIISAAIALFTAIIFAFISYFVKKSKLKADFELQESKSEGDLELQERKLRTEMKPEFMAEQVTRSLFENSR